MIRIISSSGANVILFRRHFMERVRIWLILTQDLFVSFALSSSKVRGYPALWDWLVNATAMTVPDRSLKTFSLKIRTGQNPLAAVCRWWGYLVPIYWNPIIFAHDLCHGQIEYLRNLCIENWIVRSEYLRNSTKFYETQSRRRIGATSTDFNFQ